jgi:hypothetical protein
MAKVAVPKSRMPLAEVALRLGMHVSRIPGCRGPVSIIIGDEEKAKSRDEAFSIRSFLLRSKWKQAEKEGALNYTGRYVNARKDILQVSHATKTRVTAAIAGRRLLAVCKGGPIWFHPRNDERGIILSALGDVILLEQAKPNDLLVAAVPGTGRFKVVADRWRNRPLIASSGIMIALVGRDQAVEGIDPRAGQ